MLRVLRELNGVRRASFVALLVTGALTSGCDDTAPGDRAAHAPNSSPTSAYQGTPADFAEIKRLLNQRADAIEHGDRAAFLAGLDPGSPELRRSQLQLFDNLQDLPVARIRYDPDDFGDNGEPVAGGDPTLRPDILEIVRLRDVDRRPVASGVDMTFVRRDGRWVLGVEKAETELTPTSSQFSRPWYGARIDVARRGPMVVVTDHGTADVADRLADLTAAELPAIDAFLGLPVDRAVLVDATSSGFAYDMNSDGLEAAAVTYPVGTPDGLHVAGWRIKVNPHHVEEYLDQKVVWRHELTHFAVRKLVRVSPVWLTEGLAEYVGWLPYRFGDLPLPRSEESLRAADRKIPGRVEFLEEPLVSYWISHAAVTVLMDARGAPGVKALIRAYAQATRGTGDPYGEWATDTVLRKVYGFGEAELARRTWATVDAQL